LNTATQYILQISTAIYLGMFPWLFTAIFIRIYKDVPTSYWTELITKYMDSSITVCCCPCQRSPIRGYVAGLLFLALLEHQWNWLLKSCI